MYRDWGFCGVAWVGVCLRAALYCIRLFSHAHPLSQSFHSFVLFGLLTDTYIHGAGLSYGPGIAPSPKQRDQTRAVAPSLNGYALRPPPHSSTCHQPPNHGHERETRDMRHETPSSRTATTSSATTTWQCLPALVPRRLRATQVPEVLRPFLHLHFAASTGLTRPTTLSTMPTTT
ncbi:hypothetical protein GX50_07849 [[Emmonsia] crescens]|uniref:Uncharacterized protein n=1 Tax=[Emmonsia] crescens TaxID=73230 RepID=A0A2B7Z8R4_9EURO|nr:hypothetical protein GX50_07849 [Emmonsia crescens]